MPKNLICPQCGTYQANDKTERKLIAGAKNVGKYALREGTKFVAKEGAAILADSICIDGTGSFVKRGVGKGVDYAFDKMGVKVQSLKSIKYLCHNCGQQWDGYDSPEKFNKVQMATVEAMREKDLSDKYAGFIAYVIVTIISLALVAVSFWIYSNRYIEIETTSTWLLGDLETKNYSWHYYVFWPMVIITGCMTLGFLSAAIEAHDRFTEEKNSTLENYAKEKLDL